MVLKSSVIVGPPIVLGEGRLDFAEICGGVSGPKMSHFGPSVSEKVIYPRLFGSENGNLAPTLTKSGKYNFSDQIAPLHAF